MKKVLISFLIISLCACSQNNHNDVFVMQVGDFELSCINLNKEIHIENEKIDRLEEKRKIKVLRNTSMFYIAIPTIFLSLFFVDFTGQEKDAIALHKKRIEHLNDIKSLNKCIS